MPTDSSTLWLLQIRRFSIVALPPHVEFDGQYLWNHENEDDPKRLTISSLKKLGDENGEVYVVEQWDTLSVWLDREEAEESGKTHGSKCPDGWRVIGVPSCGELAEVLQKTH